MSPHHLVSQNAPVTSWPSPQRQVLVPSWQTAAAATAAAAAAPPVQRHLVAAAADPLPPPPPPSHQDTWRRMVEHDQNASAAAAAAAAAVIPVVSYSHKLSFLCLICSNFVRANFYVSTLLHSAGPSIRAFS